jgi:hypothetical protein
MKSLRWMHLAASNIYREDFVNDISLSTLILFLRYRTRCLIDKFLSDIIMLHLHSPCEGDRTRAARMRLGCVDFAEIPSRVTLLSWFSDPRSARFC